MSNHLLGWLLLVPAVLWTGACLSYIGKIGKERKPIDGRHAAGDVLINGLAVAVVVIAAVRMLR